jgi:hypothetical protein
MPFGKTIRRAVARISRENNFDIEVDRLILSLNNLNFMPVTMNSPNRGLVKNTSNFRASSS